MNNNLSIPSRSLLKTAYAETPKRRSLLFSTFEMPERDPLPHEWEALLKSLSIVKYAPGDVIVLEGEPGDALYIIEDGKVDVWHQKEKQNGSIGRTRIAELFTGDIIGELALLTGANRAATVTAATEVTVMKLGREDFLELIQAYPTLSGSFLRKNYKRLATSYHQLEEKNEQLISSNHARVQLGTIFICVVLLMSVYSFVLGYFQSEQFLSLASAEQINFVVTRILEAITLLIIFWILRASRLSLKEFGINANRLRKQVFDSVFISFVIMLILLGAKYMMLQAGQHPFPNDILINWSYWDLTYVSYILVAPLQEFIARGVFQNTVARLIVSRHAAFWSILVTSVIFGVLHLHTSILLGLAAFITSWLWGVMFARQRSLIGVGISHFLIGNFAGLLGFWTL